MESVQLKESLRVKLSERENNCVLIGLLMKPSCSQKALMDLRFISTSSFP